MTDPTPKTAAEPRIVIDLRGDVSGMVAAGEYVYQQQVNVSDGGLVYVLEEGTLPFTKVERPVRSLPRADPPLLDREAEMAGVLGAVRPGGTVQVTAGPGGGKSLFLAHIAHRDLPVDDGVVHLRARGQPLDDIRFRLFYAFHDSRLPTAFVPPPAQIKRELAGIDAAIVVDDVDGLEDDISELLDTAADAAFVVSSRTAMVDGGAEVALGGLPSAEAADLFARAHGEPMPDRARVRQLCSLLEGHPQCVVFAARLVRAEAIDPLTLVGELTGPDPCRQLATRLLVSLPERESRVAAFIAALGGAPVPVPAVTETTHVPGTQEVLRDLSRAGIAQSSSPRYAFNALLLEAAEELWDLDERRAAAADHLTGWFEQQPPADGVAEAAPMVLQLMTWATETGRHETTVALGQGVDSALALSGLWGSWGQVLGRTLVSARQMTDGAAAEGWALHQLGTKALCWGEATTAESLLDQALAIRQTVGVQSAIDTTQHNLDVLHLPPGGLPPPDTPPPAEPGPPPAGAGGIPALVKGVAAVAVIGAIAGGAWFAFAPSPDEDGTAVGAGTPSTLEIPSEGPTPGGLQAEPSFVEFESLEVGRVAFHRVELFNDGDVPLALDEPFLEDWTDFDIGETTCPFELEGGTGCSIDVLFTPTIEDDHSDILVVTHSGEGDPLFVDLFGSAFGVVGVLPDPAQVDFDVFTVGEEREQPVTITNIGSSFSEFAFIGTDPEFPFVVADDNCGDGLEPGHECEIIVRFEPFDLETYADLAAEREPGDVPSFLGHSSVLFVETAEGATVEIPLLATTVAPYPDLVNRIEFVEPVGFSADDWPIYRVVATVTNVGGVAAGPTDVGVAFSVPDFDLGFFPLIDAEGSRVSIGELEAFDGEFTVEGFVTVPISELETGSPVDILVLADSCIGKEFEPDHCRVLELHEELGLPTNNLSEPFETEVPSRAVVGIVELPDFLDLLELFTTTSVVG